MGRGETYFRRSELSVSDNSQSLRYSHEQMWTEGGHWEETGQKSTRVKEGRKKGFLEGEGGEEMHFREGFQRG